MEKLNRTRNHKTKYEGIKDLPELLKHISIYDYFIFRYNPKECEKRFEPYHCFDGKMTVRKDGGDYYLTDGYWSSDNKSKLLNEALNQGSIEFICNLNDVEKIDQHSIKYYDNKDIVDLTSQGGYNGHCSMFKDAKRSKIKMIKFLNKSIRVSEDEIESSHRRIANSKNTIEKINNGADINKIYF